MRPKEKTENIGVRTTPERRAAWEAAAKTDGYPLSVWISRRCDGQPATPPTAAPGEERPRRKSRGGGR